MSHPAAAETTCQQNAYRCMNVFDEGVPPTGKKKEKRY